MTLENTLLYDIGIIYKYKFYVLSFILIKIFNNREKITIGIEIVLSVSLY